MIGEQQSTDCERHTGSTSCNCRDKTSDVTNAAGCTCRADGDLTAGRVWCPVHDALDEKLAEGLEEIELGGVIYRKAWPALEAMLKDAGAERIWISAEDALRLLGDARCGEVLVLRVPGAGEIP